jgi:uncharacterized membrane protein YhaH (DUF805 family)
VDFWETSRRGLRLIGRPAGADAPDQFWPYAAAVTAGFVVVGNIVSVGVFIAMSGTSPDTRTAALLAVVGVAALVLVVLLASAVVRRLHDRGVSGAWGLVPLVSFVVAFVLQARVVLTWEDQRGPTSIVIAFAAALFYFATVIGLAAQLALPRRARPR